MRSIPFLLPALLLASSARADSAASLQVSAIVPDGCRVASGTRRPEIDCSRGTPYSVIVARPGRATGEAAVTITY